MGNDDDSVSAVNVLKIILSPRDNREKSRYEREKKFANLKSGSSLAVAVIIMSIYCIHLG